MVGIRWASQEHQPDVPVGSEKACTPIVAADALVQIENMSTHEFLTEYKTRRTPNTRDTGSAHRRRPTSQTRRVKHAPSTVFMPAQLVTAQKSASESVGCKL
mmetsp:Transcript_55689/g.130500  ORF Transcript_55689/g.130500 Transcript_55689/m.130500 type:complete len:102 (+) Transcript_55689:534-839(+)